MPRVLLQFSGSKTYYQQRLLYRYAWTQNETYYSDKSICLIEETVCLPFIMTINVTKLAL